MSTYKTTTCRGREILVHDEYKVEIRKKANGIHEVVKIFFKDEKFQR